jgi:hypothetical protein
MRQIHVDNDLRLRFPGRDANFNEGVEIGLALAAMAAGRPQFSLRVAAATLDQARDLAEKMDYRIVVHQTEGGWAEITCRTAHIRPKLTLVSSNGSQAARPPAN